MTVRTALFFFATIALAGCGAEQTVIDRPLDQEPPAVSSAAMPDAPADNPQDIVELASEQPARPPSVLIRMGFASQAPHGNWDPPYDEACEEASLIIVHHYLEGTQLNADVMDRDILGLVVYEKSIGLPIDIDMYELADVARNIYGYQADVIEGADVTIDRIESELARGNPVIVPLAGQDIGNPNYSGEGPPYHVFVIVGYDERNFITHDVGTRKGENYTYRKQVIMDAIHDWTGDVNTIRSGARRLLIVRK